jgi:hypothetical protein
MQADPGLFYVCASLHDGVSPEACENTVLEIIGRVGRDGLSGEDLARARNLAVVDGLFSMESCLGCAGVFAFWESLGSWMLEESYERGLREAGTADIGAAARRYLASENRSSVWLTP